MNQLLENKPLRAYKGSCVRFVFFWPSFTVASDTPVSSDLKLLRGRWALSVLVVPMTLSYTLSLCSLRPEVLGMIASQAKGLWDSRNEYE